jgi:hypothetical protein
VVFDLTLTQKQKLFAEEYIISGNATQAAIKAGYSKKTAYSIGDENLKKPEIRAYISERFDEIEKSKRQPGLHLKAIGPLLWWELSSCQSLRPCLRHLRTA